MRRFFRRWPAQFQRGIFASLFEPFLDLVFLIKQLPNPRNNLALSLQTEEHSRKSHRIKVAFILFSQLETPSPFAGEGCHEGEFVCTNVRSKFPDSIIQESNLEKIKAKYVIGAVEKNWEKGKISSTFSFA